MHTVVVIMAIFYMLSLDGSIWVGIMMIVTPLITTALEKLTAFYQRFHFYVTQIVVLSGVVIVTLVVWRLSKPSLLLIQLLFFTVLAS